MVNLTINNRPVSARQGATIIEAAELAGINIPRLCYLKGLNEIGACRMCCVEVEGEEKLVPACENVVREGMKVTTNSRRVRNAARMNLELIMSQHDGHCPTCSRSGSCLLQKLANDFGLTEENFKKDIPAEKPISLEGGFPLVRDEKKCVKCLRCVQICEKVQSLGVWDALGTGGRARVGVKGGKPIEQADCSLCGQCVTHCPVGALSERSDVGKAIRALEDPETVTVVQIAPAIRAAWGESFGLSPEEATVERLAGVFRKMGADYVFDTSFSADLTIMEEANEFLKRKAAGELDRYPMFTSCCPGWIRFVKSQYPQLVDQLSTSKSPQQMFGAVVKSYFAQKIGVDPQKIFCISIMPCIAKKSECDMPVMRDANGIKDVDCVLTTREVATLIRSERIDPARADDSPFDRLLGDYTGAGVIFGITGGVMEAALRTAAYAVTGKNPEPDAFRDARGYGVGSANPWKEAIFDLNGVDLKVAVANGLGNARKLCEAILKGEAKYDFVEIMACPGGCSGGGGQPIAGDDVERADIRGETLRKIDKAMKIRFSHENAEVQTLYKEFLEEPVSEKAELLLHVDHRK